MPLILVNYQAFHRYYSRTVLLQLGFKPLFGIVIVLVIVVVVAIVNNKNLFNFMSTHDSDMLEN